MHRLSLHTFRYVQLFFEIQNLFNLSCQLNVLWLLCYLCTGWKKQENVENSIRYSESNSGAPLLFSYHMVYCSLRGIHNFSEIWFLWCGDLVIYIWKCCFWRVGALIYHNISKGSSRRSTSQCLDLDMNEQKTRRYFWQWFHIQNRIKGTPILAMVKIL